jgi:hypothetical protein
MSQVLHLSDHARVGLCLLLVRIQVLAVIIIL